MKITMDHLYALTFFGGVYGALGYHWYRKRFGRRPQSATSPVLLWLTKDEPFTVRDLLNGGVAIFGRTGSGKTSSSGKAIGKAIVGLPGSGGLILAAKPEDRAMWESVFKAAGRESDLLIFSPDHPLRLNFIDAEMRAGGQTMNIVRCITTIGETLRSADKKGGEDGDFWESQQARLIHNAVEILKLAYGKVTAPDLLRFISGMAATPDVVKSEKWQAGFHYQSLLLAEKNAKTEIEKHDLTLALEAWVNEYPALNDRTRSSITAGVFNTLHVFNQGIVRELVSTTTNVSPEDMFRGKWVLVDMAPSQYGDVGLFVAAGWKYLTQRAILRRHATDQSNVVTIWQDESHLFVNSHDAPFVAQCRSRKGCMVSLTQSIHSYYSVLHGDRGKHEADVLLTNFGLKVFHALGDADTAKWASGLIGRSRQVFIGGSMTPQQDMYDELMKPTRYSGSFSESFEDTLQPDVFINGLRTGGTANGLLCDAIVIRSGEPFASGQNHLFTTFKQE